MSQKSRPIPDNTLYSGWQVREIRRNETNANYVCFVATMMPVCADVIGQSIPSPRLRLNRNNVVGNSAGIQLDDTALALDGDDALFEGLEDGAGGGEVPEGEGRGRFVMRDHGDRSHAQNAVQE